MEIDTSSEAQKLQKRVAGLEQKARKWRRKARSAQAELDQVEFLLRVECSPEDFLALKAADFRDCRTLADAVFRAKDRFLDRLYDHIDELTEALRYYEHYQ